MLGQREGGFCESLPARKLLCGGGAESQHNPVSASGKDGEVPRPPPARATQAGRAPAPRREGGSAAAVTVAPLRSQRDPFGCSPSSSLCPLLPLRAAYTVPYGGGRMAQGPGSSSQPAAAEPLAGPPGPAVQRGCLAAGEGLRPPQHLGTIPGPGSGRLSFATVKKRHGPSLHIYEP